MNFAKLTGSVGKRLRLHPPAEVWHATHNRSVAADDVWQLTDVQPGASITLVNERTNQEVLLGTDHVHHFTSNPPADTSFDGTLELTVRIDLTKAAPAVSVIPSGVARTISRAALPPMRVRIAKLLNQVNPQILAQHAREVGAMVGPRNIAALRELELDPDFAELLSFRSNGAVIMGGAGNRIGNMINDLDESAGLHGFIFTFAPAIHGGEG